MRNDFIKVTVNGLMMMIITTMAMCDAVVARDSKKFDDMVSFTPDAMAAILFGLVLVLVTVLAVGCTMSIQTPTRMWTHADLPLKGRVEYE